MAGYLRRRQCVGPDSATVWSRTAASVAVLAGVLLLTMLASSASADVRATEGTSQIRQDGSTVRYELSLEYDLLVAAAGLGSPDPAEGAQGRERLLSAPARAARVLPN
ncbi:hypothetical protein [Actinopolymorpha pittospori]|uniref:Uncharacterized protein n=1 Tax=Actinopolymorpha pittospori TaxID=648752 RepID=A0A927RIQ8_9ACTN|nr:hypothetical protein [Actinopolymorpha pittospori]MBE1604818.1 hypothetical protein [Actinopolymorpha pittospori]